MLNKICINERYKVCQNVFEIFKSHEISYAVIKGAVLSKIIHNDIYYRKSGDIDILINRKDIDKVKNIMLNDGFIQGYVTDAGIVQFTRSELIFQSTMSHQMAPFIKKTTNPICPYVNVDINFEILWGESKVKCDMDYVLSHKQEVEICGQNITKLSTEMEFVTLCLHHYKDMNSIYLLSQGSLKLSLFDDIYNYLVNSLIDTEKLQNICNYLNVSDYVYYCVYYCNEIFNDNRLIEYLNLLKTEKSDSILNTFGLADNEIKEWKVSFFDRLYMNDLNNYFDKHLSENDLKKIKINKRFM